MNTIVASSRRRPITNATCARVEEWALNAEKYASLAWLDGDAYPGEQFTEAWKKITFNQFHDLAAGSGIGVIYKDAQKDYDSVRLNTDEISAKALGTLAARIDTRAIGAVPVLVFNPLGWARSGDVTLDVQMPRPAESVSVMDAADHVLPSEVLSQRQGDEHVSSAGPCWRCAVAGIQGAACRGGAAEFYQRSAGEGNDAENAALRVVVDPKTGCITSLFDKKANFETLAAGACGNELQTFTDTPKRLRRVEHRPRNAGPSAGRIDEGGLCRSDRAEPDARGDSRDADVAAVEVCAADRAGGRSGSKWRSSTTSTGTRRMFC